MIGLLCDEETDNMLSRFHRIPECNEQTDGQTDRQNCYSNIACQHTDE